MYSPILTSFFEFTISFYTNTIYSVYQNNTTFKQNKDSTIDNDLNKLYYFFSSDWFCYHLFSLLQNEKHLLTLKFYRENNLNTHAFWLICQVLFDDAEVFNEITDDSYRQDRLLQGSFRYVDYNYFVPIIIQSIYDYISVNDFKFVFSDADLTTYQIAQDRI